MSTFIAGQTRSFLYPFAFITQPDCLCLAVSVAVLFDGRKFKDLSAVRKIAIRIAPADGVDGYEEHFRATCLWVIAPSQCTLRE